MICHEACSAIMAEAKALLEAMRHVLSINIHKSLVKWCSDLGPPIQADWTPFNECFEIWRILKNNKEFTCTHISTCQNDVADLLAKMGCSQGWNYSGYTFPIFNFNNQDR